MQVPPLLTPQLATIKSHGQVSIILWIFQTLTLHIHPRTLHYSTPTIEHACNKHDSIHRPKKMNILKNILITTWLGEIVGLNITKA